MSLLDTLTPSRDRSVARESNGNSANLGPTVRPTYEIKESPEAWRLTVSLPGVNKAGLEVTAEEGQLRIIGRRGWKQPEG